MENGKRYFDTKEFRDILNRYEQMKAENICSYFDADDLYNLLLYFLFYEKANEAEYIYDYACKLHPGNSELLAKIEIRILLSSGRPEIALEKLDAIAFSEDIETLILKAEVFLALREYKTSSNIARKILQKRELQNEEIYDALSILLDCGSTQEALQIVEEKLQKNPKQHELLEAKAECLIEMRQTDEAIEIYNYLLDNNPFSIIYWEQLGRIYFMLERYGKALDCFEFELAIDDGIDYAKLMQGHCYYKLQDYMQSLTVFQGLEKKFPNDIIPKFYIALSLGKQKAHADAIEKFNEVVKLSTQENLCTIDGMIALTNLALLYKDLGMDDLAVATSCEALKNFPEYEFKQLMLDNYSLFELRDKENMTYSDIDRIDAKEWNKAEALYSYGISLFRQGVLDIALQAFLTARYYAKDKTEIDAFIAYILHTTKRDADIIQYVTGALNGKSNKLFELFDIPYKSTILPEEFIKQIES
ncbi:MAG: tetratricopeptide repeat protein [Bacteroidaceae bacterium]|nr:tetratricopeptide repeat protein [Bacteroidaceae bacterium]